MHCDVHKFSLETYINNHVTGLERDRIKSQKSKVINSTNTTSNGLPAMDAVIKTTYSDPARKGWFRRWFFQKCSRLEHSVSQKLGFCGRNNEEDAKLFGDFTIQGPRRDEFRREIQIGNYLSRSSLNEFSIKTYLVNRVNWLDRDKIKTQKTLFLSSKNMILDGLSAIDSVIKSTYSDPACKVWFR